MPHSKIDNPLRVIPLGGLGEIGLNIMVLECGDDILIIDCGVLFPDLTWLGLDLVIPNFEYLVKNKKKIKGLVITHGHEDHIGAIAFLLKEIKIPIVYASNFACRLIEEKCKEHGMGDQLLTFIVKAGDVHQLGCFSVEFIHVTHSTLESFALAIQTPHGMVVHSGDFKFDETPYSGPPTNKKRFKELRDTQPLLVLSDSTNSERCGHSKSEKSITGELEKLVKGSPGAVVIALFASNIHRVHQLMDIAQRCGRSVFLSGRSMERYVNIALEQNHLPQMGELIQPLEEIEKFPRKKILVLSTGSQGEARSSLFRLAKNENRWIKVGPGDSVVLSSRNIPGNERAIGLVINQLCKLGVDVHYEDMKSVHVSGHAYQEEQVELLKYLRPQYFIPIHGEYRQMSLHSKTATNSGYVSKQSFVMENGQVWEFDGDSARVLDTEIVPSGRKWFFQDNTGLFDDAPVRDRRAAAKAGVVSVICLLARNGKELAKDVEVQVIGFLGKKEKLETLRLELLRQAQKAFEEWSPQNERELTHEQFVGASVRRVFKKAFGTKPLVVVQFIK